MSAFRLRSMQEAAAQSAFPANSSASAQALCQSAAVSICLQLCLQPVLLLLLQLLAGHRSPHFAFCFRNDAVGCNVLLCAVRWFAQRPLSTTPSNEFVARKGCGIALFQTMRLRKQVVERKPVNKLPKALRKA